MSACKLYGFDGRYGHTWSVWTRHWYLTREEAEAERSAFLAQEYEDLDPGDEIEIGDVCTEVFEADVPAKLAPHAAALVAFISCHGDPNND